MKLTLLPVFFLSLASISAHSPRRRDSHHRHIKRNEAQPDERDLARELEGRGVTNSTGSLMKRDSYSGRGTYFEVGLGACGQWSQDTDMMVALNTPQYIGGSPGPECFKFITVQANGVTVPGVRILDECPSCDYGGLDMSPGLFQKFADLSVGVLAITWWYNGDAPAASSDTPSSTSQWEAPSSTSTWEAPSTTSTWEAPSSSTSQWVAPSTTSSSSSSWSFAPPTSASTTSPPSSSSTSSSWSTSSSFNTSINPFAVVSSYNGTSTTVSGASTSASASSGAGSSSGPVNPTGNLEMLSGLVTNYGQIVVLAAGGKSS